MAGKFLSLEEAARRLGVSIDEVNHLVDRKELFPMRDGATIKFKVDEIERVAADRGAGSSGENDDLSLDLDLSSPGLGGSIGGGDSDKSDLDFGESVDDASIFAGDDNAGPVAGSQTVVRGGVAPASGAFDMDDIGIESIVAASSPSLVKGGDDVSFGNSGEESGTLAIDLSNIGGASLAGSLPGLSGPSGAGGSLAGAVDSGLSLEGDGLNVSGIDLDANIDAGSLIGNSAAIGDSLAGDAFDLGADVADEESASVVIPTDDTGDSSFFVAAMDDAASVSFDGSEASVDMPLGVGDDLNLVPSSPPFSVWQVVGLVCCTLLLFVGVLLVFDVLATTRGPQGSPVSSPLMTGLAKTFGWR